MALKTREELESTGYRCLFEGVKKEGVEPFFEFVQGIHALSTREQLIRKLIIEGENELSNLYQKHRDIMKYIQEHQKEFARFNFMKKDILNILWELKENSIFINLYLENARRLEALRVSDIEIHKFQLYERCGIEFLRNKKGEIMNILKYYTNGSIQKVEPEKVLDQAYQYSKIEFIIDNSKKTMSYLLKVYNDENCYSCRTIQIRNFGFDGTKLPTEEELESYEIPKQYILK